MASSSAETSLKRKAEDIIIDPDTLQQLEDSKRPKIDLNSERKYGCLRSIVDMFHYIHGIAFNHDQQPEDPKRKSVSFKDTHMETDTMLPIFPLSETLYNITVGNHIISIIFTLHNTCRQEVKQGVTNMIKKTATTSFKIHYRGNDYALENSKLKGKWTSILKEHKLEYKDFSQTDSSNWYGTMGPYLDMFAAYSLRTNELRLGHNNMPITKIEGLHKSFPVSKYGLSGAHHILLEGTSFPPERRSSIVQSLGPMTAWLCMIRSEGIYRRKYAAAVKRAMSHIPCIDDIIELTKTTKQASEISILTTLVAEILLVTTARQATRMFFPITIFAAVWKGHQNHREFSDFFSSTGAGGWYTYKLAMGLTNHFTICGQMESEKASQVVFHSIFGTYKEDLSILSQITNVSNWFNREQLGTCFRQQGTVNSITKIELPVIRYYSKMSCANQSGLLSGVYNQVATVPCFSGARIHKFDQTFFEHIEKKRILSNTGKTISQIINILTSTLEEVHSTLKKDNGKLEMGTTKWRDVGTLALGRHGDELKIRLEGQGRMFLGRN